MEIKDILELKLKADPFWPEEGTIREYLGLLLFEVWMKEEGFSGKRPFGNSGWQTDLYLPLIQAGVIDGKLDSWEEDGKWYHDIMECDRKAGHRVIAECINEMTGL